MYDLATRHIKLGAVEGRAFKFLGDIGEVIAQDLLEKCHFKTSQFKQNTDNFPFADFAAERDGSIYLISARVFLIVSSSNDWQEQQQTSNNNPAKTNNYPRARIDGKEGCHEKTNQNSL